MRLLYKEISVEGSALHFMPLINLRMFSLFEHLLWT